PFMPFITEELWHELKDRNAKECIIVAPWPSTETIDKVILQEGELALEAITEIRNTRSSKGISPKEPLQLLTKGNEDGPIKVFWPVIKKMANLSEVKFVKEAPSSGATAFIVRSLECFIPMEGRIDTEKEREELQKDLEYLKGFVASVDKKL